MNSRTCARCSALKQDHMDYGRTALVCPTTDPGTFTLHSPRTPTMPSTATAASATLSALTYDEAKVGLRVVLLQAEETGAIRGRIVGKKDSWLSVRYDDGTTRMARAKSLAKDTIQVVEAKGEGTGTVSVGPSFDVAAPLVPKSATGRSRVSTAKEDLLRAARKQAASAEALGKQLAKDRKVEKTPKPRAAKPTKKVGAPCLCACGAVAKPGRAFLQGHDARFHGWMRRLADGRLKSSEVPAAALKLMSLNKDGVPTTDYDGSPWKL